MNIAFMDVELIMSTSKMGSEKELTSLNHFGCKLSIMHQQKYVQFSKCVINPVIKVLKYDQSDRHPLSRNKNEAAQSNWYSSPAQSNVETTVSKVVSSKIGLVSW